MNNDKGQDCPKCGCSFKYQYLYNDHLPCRFRFGFCNQDLIDGSGKCRNPAEEEGKPCCHCRVFNAMVEEHDKAFINENTD